MSSHELPGFFPRCPRIQGFKPFPSPFHGDLTAAWFFSWGKCWFYGKSMEKSMENHLFMMILTEHHGKITVFLGGISGILMIRVKICENEWKWRCLMVILGRFK